MFREKVMGVSAGVGKSIFSRAIGKRLGIPVYHLDALYWKALWVKAPIEEFREKQRTIVTKDQWTIEGNYASTYDIRLQHADTLIYLELSLPVCL